MRISDWSSDVCSSDLHGDERGDAEHHGHKADRGDEEDEAFALPAGDKVALGDHPFIAGQDHRISASESSFPRRRESMNTASYEYGNPASIISGHRRSWIPAFAGMTVKGITR